MPKWEHSIEIAAAPAVVWGVLIDVERWPEWTATERSVERLESTPFGLGATARLDVLDAGVAVWTVVAFEEGRSFAWEATNRGIRGIANHEITPIGTESRVLLTIDAPGLLATLVAPIIGRVMLRNLKIEAEGLKARSEELAAGRA
jgi:hypothetical protein